MNEPIFHTVDPESLKNITLDQILAPKNPLETADYNAPVAAENETTSAAYSSQNFSGYLTAFTSTY
jgi:hypothetical protein